MHLQGPLKHQRWSVTDVRTQGAERPPDATASVLPHAFALVTARAPTDVGQAFLQGGAPMLYLRLPLRAKHGMLAKIEPSGVSRI